jgi:hypothetical protein
LPLSGFSHGVASPFWRCRNYSSEHCDGSWWFNAANICCQT